MPSTKASIRVSYWTDPLCIWAFLAEDKLTRILEEFGDRLILEHRVIPVFGSVPWRFTAGPWAAGGVAGRVEATRRVAAEHGHPEVSGAVWQKVNVTSSWAVAAAVKAVFAGADAGELEPRLAAEYQRRLRQRFFVDEENICQRSVQLATADELRIPRSVIERRLDDGAALAAVFEDYSEKEQMRLLGSPTWVFDGGRAQLYGNVAFNVLHATIEELVRGAVAGGSAC